MQTILLLLYPIFNSILNRYPRGTYSWGPWAVGPTMGLIIFLITSNYIAALAFVALYIAGESFGWGKWLAAIPIAHDKSFTQEMYNSGEVKASNIPLIERKDGKSNGVHLLANLISKETEDFRSYAWYALMFRGLLWYAPIFGMFAFLGVANMFVAVIAAIVVAIMFPICYNLTYKLFGQATYWPYGELLYGFVQGSAVAIALASGIYL